MSKELLSGTPLKWVGGKSRIMNTLKAHLPEADCLVEPFVGGASVFMNTSYKRYILGDSFLPASQGQHRQPDRRGENPVPEPQQQG